MASEVHEFVDLCAHLDTRNASKSTNACSDSHTVCTGNISQINAKNNIFVDKWQRPFYLFMNFVNLLTYGNFSICEFV